MTPLGFDDDLRELLMEHYRHPRHRGQLPQPSHSASCFNSYCGEQLNLELDIEGGRISDVGYTGEVCSVTQTAASLMSEHLIGRSVRNAKQTSKRFRRMMKDGEPDPELGEMSTLAKVAAFPGRVNCALLAWRALDEALSSDG